jgi:hypothetical protein
MAKRTDQRSVTVPFRATPAEQPPSVKEWANRLVWTDRMLTALEQGVRGGRWHTLIDKVYQPVHLWMSSLVVLGKQGAAGVDRQTVDDFQEQDLAETQWLAEELRTDQYRPQAVRRVWIPKPGSTEKRPLGIPAVRDRVVQTALLHVLAPIFESRLPTTVMVFDLAGAVIMPWNGSKPCWRKVTCMSWMRT